jgi:hypothetical protein
MNVLFGWFRATIYDKEERNNFLFNNVRVFDPGPITQLYTSPFREGLQDLVLLELALPHYGHFTKIQEFGLKENWTLRQRKILFFPLQGDKMAHLLKCSARAGTNVIETCKFKTGDNLDTP